MIEPWQPIEEMDHDALRRYSHELLAAWANQGAPLPAEKQVALIDRVEMVECQMKKLGLEPMMRLRRTAL